MDPVFDIMLLLDDDTPPEQTEEHQLDLLEFCGGTPGGLLRAARRQLRRLRATNRRAFYRNSIVRDFFPWLTQRSPGRCLRRYRAPRRARRSIRCRRTTSSRDGPEPPGSDEPPGSHGGAP